MTKRAEKHLRELIEDYDTAMLVTTERDNRMHGRPMAVADVDDKGAVYFATSNKSAKVKEVKKDATAYVIFQGDSKYVTLRGESEIIEDRALIDELWKEDWKIWFPKGKDDPNLCIMKVNPVEAEYWDNSGAEGLSYAFKAATAYLTGTTPSESHDEHGKLKL
jgi:general stress protein 26